ncbi:hypothetical protein BXZ70DRAFT_465099 [Cristinia sonorae]|uniref:Uncharacterized protein n=1 Tax=Cristinia sonorae TaxID=1940300 RepID=A0A8K0XMH5_9AGAR|nr:hypothetical protein BXZ70DRAFT_465099 [Cristinia sonorae]
MNPRIPPEITDIFVDFLHDDTPSLLTSSLVCRAFLPSARHHLFRAVTLDVATRPPSSSSSYSRVAESFLDFLVDAPHIGALVRTLSLRGNVNGRVVGGETETETDAGVVRGILRHVPRLNTLVLDSLYWKLSPSGTLPIPDCTTSCPRTLVIRNMAVRGWSGAAVFTTEAVVDLLSHFKGISDLEVDSTALDVDVVHDRNTVSHALATSLRGLALERLVCRQSTSLVSLLQITSARDQDQDQGLRLRSVGLQVGFLSDAYASRSFLVQVGPYLQDLTLDMVNPHHRISPDTLERTYGAGLSHCTRLETLRVNVDTRRDSKSGLSLLAGLLRRCAPPGLRRLTITMVDTDTSTDTGSELEGLDACVGAAESMEVDKLEVVREVRSEDGSVVRRGAVVGGWEEAWESSCRRGGVGQLSL